MGQDYPFELPLLDSSMYECDIEDQTGCPVWERGYNFTSVSTKVFKKFHNFWSDCMENDYQ
jgi:hypothetical protein